MRLLLAFLVAVALIGAPVAALEGSYQRPSQWPQLERVFEGGFIVSFLFEADGTIVYGELTGAVKRFDPATGDHELLVETTAVTGPEWGLTGVAKDDDGAIYTMYTTGPDGIDPESNDVTGELRVSRWVGGVETVILLTEATRSHNGGRLLWHNDTLLVTIGEHTRGVEPMAKRMTAQDPLTLAGKVLRMRGDGSPAPGNPAETDPRFHPLVYSYGHRNPFGLAWDEDRDTLVVSDPAHDHDEEINQVPKGANLGWPLCVGPCDPPDPSMIDPIVLYPTVITPVGLAVVGDDYYVGAFNDKEIRRVYETPAGWTDQIVAQTTSAEGILDVQGSPDGKWIYLGTWNGLWRFPTPQGGNPSSRGDGGGASGIPGLGFEVTLVAAVAVAIASRRR